jgi:hypothetical protein
MRLRIFLPLALLASPVPASAGDDSEFSTKETRALTHGYAKCVVQRQAAKASEAIVSNVDNPTLLRRYPMLISSDCLGGLSVVTVQMRFTGDLYRYALADALVNRELAGWTAPDLSRVPRLSHDDFGEPPARMTPAGKPVGKRKYEAARQAYERKVGFAYLSRFGECVVRSDPADSKALLLTRPDTPEETAAFAALRPSLQACLAAGQTLSFGKAALRGTIAINFYRVAHAARAAATGTAG